MAKKRVIGGLAVGVGALVLAPEARMWLRRRLGLEPEDRRWFEEDGVEDAEHEGDGPLDTRESRFSLRARSEDGNASRRPPSHRRCSRDPKRHQKRCRGPRRADRRSWRHAGAARRGYAGPTRGATPPPMAATPAPGRAEPRMPEPAPPEPAPFASMEQPAAGPSRSRTPTRRREPAPFGAMEATEPCPACRAGSAGPAPESTPFSPRAGT
jgi:hypothetical protein